MLVLERDRGEALTIGEVVLKIDSISKSNVHLIWADHRRFLIERCTVPPGGTIDVTDAEVIVIATGRNTVRLGIKAPKEIQILRDDAKQRSKKNEDC
jgi:sRNA-binding carbon storage regulator CsrA